MDGIVVKSREPETGIMYSFLLSQEDALRVIDRRGDEYIEIKKGYVGFREELIMIKTDGAPAFLLAQEVLDQIHNQLDQASTRWKYD